MYEVVEMQDLVTSSTKSRYTPAQLPQEGTATQPVESEANKETAPAQEENEEIYLNCE